MRKEKQYCHFWNDYYLDLDGTQYTLLQKKTAVKKDSKEEYDTYNVLGYFTNFESITNKVIKQEQAKELPKDMYELWQKTIQIVSELKAIIKSGLMISEVKE